MMKTYQCFPALVRANPKFLLWIFTTVLIAFTPPHLGACELEQVNVPNCEEDNSATFTVNVSGINLTKVTIASTSGFTYTSLSFNGTANTFTFSEVSISNYKGFGSFTVNTEYSDRSTCQISGYVVECCSEDDYDFIFVEQTIPAASYNAKTIWLYGEIDIASGTTFFDDQILLATDAQINLQNNVTAEFEECRLTRLCEYAWDGIILDNSNKTLNLLSTQLDNSLRGIFASNNASISLDNASLYSNRISLYINNYSSDVIDVDGSDFDEIQIESSIVQHPSSGITMSSYFPSYCGGSVNQATAPIVIKNSASVYLGASGNTVNTFSNTNSWGGDNTFINVDNSQVFIRNNTFNSTNQALCAYDESRITFGGTATAEANTARAQLTLENSSFYIDNNTIESSVFITDVDFTNPGTGTEDGGQIINNDFSNEAILSVDQNTNNSYLRVYNNSFTDYRISFTDFTAQSNGKLIFHTNDLNNDGYNTYAAVVVNNCDGMTFAENVLEGPNPSTPSGAKTNLGIDWIATGDVDIYKNTIRYFNRGINLSDDGSDGNSGTQLICNAFLNNYYQIFLEDATIDDQESASGTSSGNCYGHMFGSGNPNPYYEYHLYGTSSQPVSTTWHVEPTSTNCSGSNPDCKCLTINASNPLFSSVSVSYNQTSANCNISIPNKSSLQELKSDIYPNPVGSDMLISLKEQSTIRISNTSGHILFAKELPVGESLIDVSFLKDGVYILYDGEKSFKFIKK